MMNAYVIVVAIRVVVASFCVTILVAHTNHWSSLQQQKFQSQLTRRVIHIAMSKKDLAEKLGKFTKVT